MNFKKLCEMSRVLMKAVCQLVNVSSPTVPTFSLLQGRVVFVFPSNTEELASLATTLPRQELAGAAQLPGQSLGRKGC